MKTEFLRNFPVCKIFRAISRTAKFCLKSSIEPGLEFRDLFLVKKHYFFFQTPFPNHVLLKMKFVRSPNTFVKFGNELFDNGTLMKRSHEDNGYIYWKLSTSIILHRDHSRTNVNKTVLSWFAKSFDEKSSNLAVYFDLEF